MIRNLLALVLFAWTTSSVGADTQAESFFDHHAWNVGTVPRTTTYHHFFQVTNTTDKPLHIASIRVSCGCVSASAVKHDLAPGERTMIMAHIETRQFTGVITKTIFVLLDQPQLEEVRINVQANILPDLSISPGTLNMGKLKKGNSQEASVIVSLPANRFPLIEKATSESAYVHVRVEPVSENSDTQSYRVTAKLSPDLPVGNWYCSIWLAGAQPTEAPITISMTVEIAP